MWLSMIKGCGPRPHTRAIVHSSNDPVVETRRALENELARMAAEPSTAKLYGGGSFGNLGATSLTAARLLGKLALAGRDSEFPGAKAPYSRWRRCAVRDLARVLLRLDAAMSPFHGGRAPTVV